MKILIVDDEPEIVDYMREVLQEAFSPLQIQHSPNGAHALHLCSETMFNLIITDYRMPVMNGLEFARFLRRGNAPSCESPILFLSGLLEAFKMEADVLENVIFLSKPPAIERLLRNVSLALKVPLA